jgi:uncharacterized protein (TIRG00374 family)
MLKYLLAASIAILALLIALSNPAKILALISTVNATVILAVLLLSLLSLCLRVLKWNVLLEDVKYVKLFPVQAAGIAISNLTPGKIAEPSKALILKGINGVPVSKSLPTIIWERILDVSVLVVFSIMTLTAYGSRFFLWGILGIVLFAAFISAMLIVLYHKNLAMAILKKLKRFQIFRKIPPNFIESFYATKIKKPRIIASLIITFAAWTIDGAIFYMIFASLGQNITLLEILSIMSLSMIISIASFLPGGLGSFEAVMTLILSFRLDASLALSGVLLSRLFTLWVSLFIGFACLAYLSRKSLIKWKIF